jgi:hypothetical protein
MAPLAWPTVLLKDLFKLKLRSRTAPRSSTEPRRYPSIEEPVASVGEVDELLVPQAPATRDAAARLAVKRSLNRMSAT